MDTPTIAEDTLQYTLHPGPGFPNKSAVTTLATLIDSYVSSLLPNHIWHRDAFEVKVISSPHIPGNWSIEGRMRVGDCVDDEWCVVWLLRDISRRWDVAVNVFDSDGDFLLIEAAEHLPPWIKPTNAENRVGPVIEHAKDTITYQRQVWIYSGRLHLVPLQYISLSPPNHERRMRQGAGGNGDESEQGSATEYISLADAVKVVRNAREDTLAAPNMEHAAFRRVEGYPDAVRQHVHRTKAYVPSDIALALSNCPSLIQKATEAFYTRDAFQMRAANRMARFPPDSSVLVKVSMTRTAYAQLMGQKFLSPKIFGQWKEKKGSSEWRWRDIGIKIACGFEMMYQENKGRHEIGTDRVDGSEVSLEARKETLRRDPEYVRYIKDLSDVGFFKDEVEGSSLWKNQENRAAAQFIQGRQTDNASRLSFASLVNSAILQAQIQIGNEGPSSLLGGEEDSDGWLLVDENMVDNMLARAQITTDAQGEGDMDVEKEDYIGPLEENQAAKQASKHRKLAEQVGKFVEGEGDVEGATFEDDVPSDESDMSELSDSDDKSISGSLVDDTAERQAAMDGLVPALDPSEYGRMPPLFHSNSQNVKGSTVGTESSPTGNEPKQAESPSPKLIRPLVFPRDEFDGVEDSDDESEEEVIGGDEDEEDEEDHPQVVGELEVDMQEEAEEFLKFSREALGISSEMWKDIVQDRKDRDAFIPTSALREESTQNIQMPLTSTSDNSGGFFEDPERPSKNSNLDSFEAVMRAMDAELSRAKRDKALARAKATPLSLARGNSENKGKQKADPAAGAALDAELHLALQNSSDDDQDEEATIDYTLMKNFLESFKSQQGLPGPVGNLIGRLGWQLPRDEN